MAASVAAQSTVRPGTLGAITEAPSTIGSPASTGAAWVASIASVNGTTHRGGIDGDDEAVGRIRR